MNKHKKMELSVKAHEAIQPILDRCTKEEHIELVQATFVALVGLMAETTLALEDDRRERLAGMAMQGLIVADSDNYPEPIAEWAVQYADALIAALDKGQETGGRQ